MNPKAVRLAKPVGKKSGQGGVAAFLPIACREFVCWFAGDLAGSYRLLTLTL